MSLGLANPQGDLFDDVARFCGEALSEGSVYSVLARERDRLFPDGLFSDLFSDRGRRSVPPSVVATVMVLQRLEGLSDREAVERYTFDARWRYAAGVGGYDTDGWPSFSHTVLVDMRARLAGSDDPRRIFSVTVQAAQSAGLVGAKRVLDSTPLYDAVATMDTVTLIRSAIRGLLKVADDGLAAELRAVMKSGDDYVTAAKPHIDWDDADARQDLVDSRAKDAYAALAVLDGRELTQGLAEAAALLATVLGQDLEEDTDGVLRIARRVAKDRIISTVDPEARHGHKTSARGFDGYKGHVALDPDTEVITATTVTAGNAGDASVAEDLISDLHDDEPESSDEHRAGRKDESDTADDDRDCDNADDGADVMEAEAGDMPAAANEDSDPDGGEDNNRGRRTVYGDCAYGTGEFLDHLAQHHLDSRCKAQTPVAPGGLFPKGQFHIDLDDDTVTCPNGTTVGIRRDNAGDGVARFGGHCRSCPLRAECTTAKGGRSIRVGRYEHRLAEARSQQAGPDWVGDYRATRPKVERKIGHLMRRKHGGRRARMRGKNKVDADFNLLAAAHNLARLAALGLAWTPQQGWATTR